MGVGFRLIHQEGKLSLPLGKWVVFPLYIRGESCHCLWVSGWFSPDTSGGKAVIAFGLVGGFPLIHLEGKLSLPLGKWVVFA